MPGAATYCDTFRTKRVTCLARTYVWMLEIWKEICKYIPVHPGRLKLLDASSRTPCPASCCSQKMARHTRLIRPCPCQMMKMRRLPCTSQNHRLHQEERQVWGVPDPRPTKGLKVELSSGSREQPSMSTQLLSPLDALNFTWR